MELVFVWLSMVCVLTNHSRGFILGYASPAHRPFFQKKGRFFLSIPNKTQIQKVVLPENGEVNRPNYCQIQDKLAGT
jgi:hypothetical protein